MGCAALKQPDEPASPVGVPSSGSMGKLWLPDGVEEVEKRRVSVARLYSADAVITAAQTNSKEGPQGGQLDFAMPDQTLIIFDWDDTLCATSALRKLTKLDDWGQPMASEAARKELEPLGSQIISSIQSARSKAKVVIVTNAKRPWVEKSCEMFMPACSSAVADIKVFYAQEMCDGEIDGSDPNQLTEAKQIAIKTALTDFYSQSADQSWKNVISIGDSFIEHNAVCRVTSNDHRGEKCRTKTLYLLDQLSVSGMITQLSIIEKVLQNVINLDDDVDINFGNGSGIEALKQLAAEPDPHQPGIPEVMV